MSTRRRVRGFALLMCSAAFTVSMVMLASAAPVGPANCCQSCESLDSTCPSACASECDGNPSCLQTCYGECQDQSDACWEHCIYCSYGACSYVWWLIETPSGHILDSWCD